MIIIKSITISNININNTLPFFQMLPKRIFFNHQNCRFKFIDRIILVMYITVFIPNKLEPEGNAFLKFTVNLIGIMLTTQHP